jgi:transposase
VRGRQLLVERVCVQGWAVAHAAKAQGVSRQCAHRWIKRFRDEGEAGLHDRSSRPHQCPSQTPVEVEEAIVAKRRVERRGQDWLGPELGVPARTVSRVLRRHGVPYLRECDPLTGEVIRASKTTAVRYERERPGELVHVDVKKVGKIPDGGGCAAFVLRAGSSSSPTAPGRTARSNGSTAPCKSSGPTVRSSSPTPNEQLPLRHGSSTTTLSAATPHSTDVHRSADCHQRDGRVHLAVVGLGGGDEEIGRVSRVPITSDSAKAVGLMRSRGIALL